MPPGKLVTLEERDARAAAKVLARAFHDNPVARHALRGEGPVERTHKLERMYWWLVKACCRFGEPEAVSLDGAIAASALVYAPGAYPLSVRGWLFAGIGALGIGPIYTWRYAKVDAFMHEHHPKSRHYYLFMLGTEPERQGQGLGRVLLDSLGDRADAAKTDIYLETDVAANVKLYERFGYEVIGEGEVKPFDRLKMWLMLRKPR